MEQNKQEVERLTELKTNLKSLLLQSERDANHILENIEVCQVTHTHTNTLTHTHTLTHTYIYTHLHTRAHTLTHTYIHACMHTYIHTHTPNTHTNTHTPTHLNARWQKCPHCNFNNMSSTKLYPKFQKKMAFFRASVKNLYFKRIKIGCFKLLNFRLILLLRKVFGSFFGLY